MLVCHVFSVSENEDLISVALGDLTGKKIAFGSFEGSEAYLMTDITNLADNPYEGFFVTGRIRTLDSKGNVIGHQVNINEKARDVSLSTASTKIQPIVDTSTVDRKTTMGNNKIKESLFKVYWFKEIRE
jgi:hypothetical protein